MCEILIRNGLLRQHFVHWRHLLNICWYWSKWLSIFKCQCIEFYSDLKRGRFLNENWNTSQDWLTFLNCERFSSVTYATTNSGCLWGRRTGGQMWERNSLFMLYPFMFFWIFFLCMCFIFGTKQVIFLNLCLQRQTRNAGLLLPANSHSFSQDPVPSQYAQPVVIFWNTGWGWGTFIGIVVSVVVTSSVTQMDIYGGW